MSARRRADECDTHLVPIDPMDGCRYCLRYLADAPDPDDMTRAERLDELERWLLCDTSVPQEPRLRRIERLIGRQVSLYELEDPDRLMQRAFRPRRTDWDW